MKKTSQANPQDRFSRAYWETNYTHPENMDCIGNANDHVRYLKYFFKLEHVALTSVIDYGAGEGTFFEKVLAEFLPYKAVALEPSRFALTFLRKKNLKPIPDLKVKIVNEDLAHFCAQNKTMKAFDLGLCTSVFQYLSEDEINFCLPIMAHQIRYLYFTVPTNKELKKQIEDHDFKDTYAIHRSRTWYQNKIKRYFTCISARVLESKLHFNEETTQFTDLLYRF